MARIKPKSRLTPELQDKIVSAVALGNYHYVAAQSNGVSESTFNYWMSRGSDDLEEGKKTRYVDFYNAI